MHQGKSAWGHRKKVTIGPALDDDWILDIKFPELWEINSCCRNPPVCSILLWQPKLRPHRLPSAYLTLHYLGLHLLLDNNFSIMFSNYCLLCFQLTPFNADSRNPYAYSPLILWSFHFQVWFFKSLISFFATSKERPIVYRDIITLLSTSSLLPFLHFTLLAKPQPQLNSTLCTLLTCTQEEHRRSGV